MCAFLSLPHIFTTAGMPAIPPPETQRPRDLSSDEASLGSSSGTASGLRAGLRRRFRLGAGASPSDADGEGARRREAGAPRDGHAGASPASLPPPGGRGVGRHCHRADTGTGTTWQPSPPPGWDTRMAHSGKQYDAPGCGSGGHFWSLRILAGWGCETPSFWGGAHL